MTWKSRRQEQEAVDGMIRMLVVGALIICVAVAACTIQRMEQIGQKPQDQLKREKLQDAAMIQARWESKARAKAEAQP